MADRVVRIRSGLGAVRKRDVAVIVLLALSGVILVAAVSGLATVKVFHQYSTIKWATLVVAPLLVAVLLTVRRPSLWAAGLLIVTIPVEPYVATIHSQPVSILAVTAILATFVVTVEGGVRSRRVGPAPVVARVMPWILVLLILPTLLGTDWQHEALYLALFIDVVWITLRVASLYPDGRLVLVLVFLGSAAAQSVVALAQYVTGHSFNLYGGAGTATYSAQNYFFQYGTKTRTTGTFFDPISLGNVLAMAIPLALLVVLRRELRPGYRWFAAITGLTMLGGLTVSLSRASWLGALAGIAAVILFSRGEQRRRAAVVSVTLLVGVGLLATVLYGPAITARFNSIFHPTAATVRTSAGDKLRQAEWSDSWRVFQTHPITGLGFGNLVGQLEEKVTGTTATSEAQSAYLQYLAEGGVFGGAALLLFMGGVVGDLYRLRRHDWLYPGLVGSFVTIGATWITDITARYMAVAGCIALLVGLAASGATGAPGADPTEGARSDELPPPGHPELARAAATGPNPADAAAGEVLSAEPSFVVG